MSEMVTLWINGRRHDVAGPDALRTLTDFLRRRLDLTGTKVVCEEGDCGACTVLLGRPREDGKTLRYRPIDACILFVFQCHGLHVVTVEGLSRDRSLTVIQDALVRGHGSQCGFCTPGIVMALHGLREDESSHDACLHEETVRLGLSGNLCRCTGYQQILDACTSLEAEDVSCLSTVYDDAALIAELRRVSGSPITLEAAVPTPHGEPEPTNGHPGATTNLPTQRVTLHLPRSLDEAARFKHDHPDARVVAGATDLGVQHNHGTPWPAAVLDLHQVAGLSHVGEHNGLLSFGATATWTDIERFVCDRVPEYHAVLQRFGSPQIRHVGTIAGNIANGSPIADCLPFHFVMESELEAASVRGIRRIPLNGFYTGYKQNVLKPDELLTAVHTPLPGKHDRLKLYKVSKRRDLDISTFTAGVRLRLDPTGDTIERAWLALGGVAATVVRLPKTEAQLVGQPFTKDVMRAAGRTTRDEITPIDDVRGSATYRHQLAENILLKTFHDLQPSPVTA